VVYAKQNIVAENTLVTIHLIIIEMLRLVVLSGPLINIDETTVQVLAEPDRKPQSKSYAWVFRGGIPGMSGLYYHYAPSRSGKIAGKFLKDYEGYVQTDGYAGYNFLDFKPGIIHSGCWAHVRRKFNDVVKAAGGKYKGKANGLEPSKYLRYLFEKFPYAKTSEDVFNLLPMNISEKDLKK
jgi:hypothetical protein